MADPRDSWWVIYGGEIHAALRRVADGADPELTWVELYANTSNDPEDRLADIVDADDEP